MLTGLSADLEKHSGLQCRSESSCSEKHIIICFGCVALQFHSMPQYVDIMFYMTLNEMLILRIIMLVVSCWHVEE